MSTWNLKRTFARGAITALIWGVAITKCPAQYSGRVTASGVPLPGATITGIQLGKTFTAVTDVDGVYQLPDIKAGVCRLHIEMQGFRAVDATITIPEGTPSAAVEMQMMPLAEVLATAKSMLPNGPAPVVTANVGRAAVKGKAKESGDNSASPPPPSDSATAESAKSADGMLINGSENNAATSKYSLAQAFGSRRAGSKSLYNGSVGFQLAASPFDAKQYSVAGLQLAKPSYTQFTGLATLGGPIRIPHLFYNGPTFFIAYQWTRNNAANILPGLVPTVAQRSGDLSGAVVTDPVTGLRISGPVPISPQAAALLALYPLPNITGNTSYNYQTQVVNGTHADAMETRLNKSIGRRDSFFGGFAFQNLRSNSANLFQFRDTTKTFGIDTNMHWQHRFPHQLFVDTSYRFARLRTDIAPYFASRTNISGNAGITGNNQDATNWGPPDLNFLERHQRAYRWHQRL